MPGWLKRPRAQARDPEVRRAAVHAEPLDALGAPLAEFARSDADPGVRRAALERAADAGLAAERMREDADAAVRAAARTLWLALCAGTHAQAAPLGARLAGLAALEDSEALEHIACTAPETALREAALQRLERPALTRQRLLDDPDPALRLRLLEGVDDEGALEEIIRRSRRRDKAVYRRAREQLQDLRVARGDPDAIRAAAEALCRALEAGLTDDDHAGLLARVEARWQHLDKAVDAALRTRHDNARQQLLAAQRARSAPPAAPEPDAAWPARRLPRMDEPEHPSRPVESSSPEVRQLAADQRFQASLAASVRDAAPPAAADPAVDPAAAPARPAPAPAPPWPFAQRLRELETALEGGNLARAIPLLGPLRAHQGEMPGKLRPRWQAAEARVSELARWQQWSTRRKRRQLCVDARRLRDRELHPEAVANRIAELRRAWAELDAIEPDEVRAQAANVALQRRFHAQCQRALAPTRAWFAARDAARAEHTAATEALLAEPAPEADDFKAMARRRSRLARARRELGQAAPGARKRLARALAAAIKAVEEPLNARSEQVERGHARLITRARELAALPPGEQVAAAQALQRDWQALGPGRRGTDRRQWRAFRTALDAVFAARDAARRERSAARAEEQQAARAWLTRTRTALDAAVDAADLGPLLHAAEREWQALPGRDSRASKDWAALRAAAEARLQALAADARRAQHEAWWSALVAGETRPDMPAAWRSADARGASAPAPADLRAWLVRLELLAGSEGVAEDAALRMQLNLERLQASLGGGRRPTPRAELDALLAELAAFPGGTLADAGLLERAHAAFAAALERCR